ncbi:MAG: GTP cyclohydrolase I, partial [Alphaproteobacteria bacterium]|nr:GTP cyclohydrolase I [Alphaproteobacteria bacterium]
LTKQIAEALHSGLSPKGVAVMIEAEHACMTTRGANKPDAHLVTQFFTGCFKTDIQAQERVSLLLSGGK